MRPVLQLLAGLVVLTVGLLPARAGEATGPSSAQLKAEDARRRVEAATHLGSTGASAAVKPLCDALRDSDVAVRVASAAALGKLGKSEALPCLQKALQTEKVPTVKTQIQSSMTGLRALVVGGGPSSPPPPPGPEAQFYVAIRVSNKTARSNAEIDAKIRSAMQAKLLSKKGFAVAPRAETSAQGARVVKGKKLKGFMLTVSVEPPVYGGGELSQRVRITMTSYPSGALQGEIAPKVTQSGADAIDIASEDALMKMCAESGVDAFQQRAAKM